MRFSQDGVAFFDSGIGGLTVLSTCEKRLANENFYYYGDNSHAPYGNLPIEGIRAYVTKAFDLFSELRVKAAVIACNTVTAVLAEELRAKYTFPIIGAEPAVLQAAKYGGEIFVLTTRATYESIRFQNLCQIAEKRYPSSKIVKVPCDGLAGEIERNLGGATERYEKLLPVGNPSAVVLGCTHYIYIKEYIRARYGCPVLDGNEGIANRLRHVLADITDKNLGFITTESNFFEKSRDGRPPNKNFTQNYPLFSGKKVFTRKKKTKANKCSRLNFKKVRKFQAKSNVRRVCFLGKNRQKNLKIYKQMFVF